MIIDMINLKCCYSCVNDMKDFLDSVLLIHNQNANFSEEDGPHMKGMLISEKFVGH